MNREEIYRCNTLYHIRKEYGERQDRYSEDHSVSVELVRLHISHIEDNDAVNDQIHYADRNAGYEYPQHPENDVGCRRVRNKPTQLGDIMTEPDHKRIVFNQGLETINDELNGSFH